MRCATSMYRHKASLLVVGWWLFVFICLVAKTSLQPTLYIIEVIIYTIKMLYQFLPELHIKFH